MSITPMVTLEAALKMLPKYTGVTRDSWRMDGNRTMTNAQLLPPDVVKQIQRVMQVVTKTHFQSKVEEVDVGGNEIWVFHRHLATSNLMWLAKREWSTLQNWPKKDLPIYLRWKDRLIIWNGTHRMTLGRLRGLPVRACVYDLNEFAEWRKTHPPGWDAKTTKPVKKAKARGNR